MVLEVLSATKIAAKYSLVIYLIIFGANANAVYEWQKARQKNVTFKVIDYVIAFFLAGFTGLMFGVFSKAILDVDDGPKLYAAVGIGTLLGFNGLNRVVNFILKKFIPGIQMVTTQQLRDVHGLGFKAILQWCLVAPLVATIISFFYEHGESLILKSLPHNVWFNYEYTRPYLDENKVRDTLWMSSKAEYARVVSISWNDILRCGDKDEEGNRPFFSNYTSSGLVKKRLMDERKWRYGGDTPKVPMTCDMTSIVTSNPNTSYAKTQIVYSKNDIIFVDS